MSDLRRYLRQQRALFGDDLIVDPAVARALAAGPDAGAGDDARDAAPGDAAQQGAARRTTRRGASAAEGDSLFGDAAASDAGRGDEVWRSAGTLDELEAGIRDCLRCPLGHTRTKFVFGVGRPDADAVLVGEAPGADEDRRGEPFVGRAGKLLNDILAAIGLQRDEVYICNILKCRPPNNRDPLPSEVEHCEPYLHRQLEVIRPKIMLALGRIAAQTLLRTKDSLTVLRSGVHRYQGVPLLVTYHPAALLRNPDFKRPTWEDVQRFRAMYDELRGGRTP